MFVDVNILIGLVIMYCFLKYRLGWRIIFYDYIRDIKDK